MSWRRPMRPKEDIEFVEGQHYNLSQLDQIADQFLRAQAKVIDPETGKKRGIGGENPILFEEHMHQRRRREIHNQNGVPDPELVIGLYWRAHPGGRKINPKSARDKGASYYR